MTEKIKSAVWAEGQKNQMNRAFAFVLDLGKKQWAKSACRRLRAIK